MTTGSTSSQNQCPDCGAAITGDEKRCWLCHAPLPATPEAVSPSAARQPVLRRPQSFGLNSLMMVVTLIAVVLGMFTAAPGLGIVLAILASPALVRTLAAARIRKERGEQLTVATKVETFFSSLAIVLVVAVAGMAAFLAACGLVCGVAFATETYKSERVVHFVIFPALIISALFALVTTGLMFRRFWPKRDRTPRS